MPLFSQESENPGASDGQGRQPSAAAQAELVDRVRAFIQVSDLDKALSFYRDLLGFHVLLTAPYDNHRLRKMVNMGDDVIPTVAIMSADGKSLTFSLLYVPGRTIDAAANRRNAPTLVADRSDVLAIYTRATAGGYEVIFPPDETRDAEQKLIARELALVDPDGNRLLILEKF